MFLNALVPAIENFPLEKGKVDDDEAHCNVWNVFVKRILHDGYLLPGHVEDLSRRRLSWVVKWPEQGFKSTAVFNTLQYAGRFRTINDIPSIEVNPGSNSSELTVELTDGSKYTINPKDLESIIYMTPGIYPMQEAIGSKSVHDLLIQETEINRDLYHAIKISNENN